MSSLRHLSPRKGGEEGVWSLAVRRRGRKDEQSFGNHVFQTVDSWKKAEKIVSRADEKCEGMLRILSHWLELLEGSICTVLMKIRMLNKTCNVIFLLLSYSTKLGHTLKKKKILLLYTSKIILLLLLTYFFNIFLIV